MGRFSSAPLGLSAGPWISTTFRPAASDCARSCCTEFNMFYSTIHCHPFSVHPNSRFDSSVSPSRARADMKANSRFLSIMLQRVRVNTIPKHLSQELDSDHGHAVKAWKKSQPMECSVKPCPARASMPLTSP